MIAARVGEERRVRRLQEVSGVSVHLDGPAGRASWVSGSQLHQTESIIQYLKRVTAFDS